MSRILIIGSGGREHAIAWSLVQSGRHELFCAPGNAGTALLAENVSVDADDLDGLLRLACERNIDLTVVGPEMPLAEGIVDRFTDEGLTIFGPAKSAAMLESSKLFARDFMAEYKIPHPGYKACKSPTEVQTAVEAFGFPIVLKADGLAAGKGVIICVDENDLEEALNRFFEAQTFGDAGLTLSVEECLIGTEMSVFAICDGKNYTILGTAQDYKRAYNGDTGPNTGGMGSLAPSPLATDTLLEAVGRDILQPTIDGMRERGTPYRGFLYAGLMIVRGKPYVIEYNVRMGDPEAQAVLPLLTVPLYDLLAEALQGNLKPVPQPSGKASVCVVVAAEGYPGSYPKGMPIEGLDKLEKDIHVFHAGTSHGGLGQLISSGGRVLNVVAQGADYREAADKVYGNLPLIEFPKSFYRTDIGG